MQEDPDFGTLLASDPRGFLTRYQNAALSVASKPDAGSLAFLEGFKNCPAATVMAGTQLVVTQSALAPALFQSLIALKQALLRDWMGVGSGTVQEVLDSWLLPMVLSGHKDIWHDFVLNQGVLTAAVLWKRTFLDTQDKALITKLCTSLVEPGSGRPLVEPKAGRSALKFLLSVLDESSNQSSSAVGVPLASHEAVRDAFEAGGGLAEVWATAVALIGAWLPTLTPESGNVEGVRDVLQVASYVVGWPWGGVSSTSSVVRVPSKRWCQMLCNEQFAQTLASSYSGLRRCGPIICKDVRELMICMASLAGPAIGPGWSVGLVQLFSEMVMSAAVPEETLDAAQIVSVAVEAIKPAKAGDDVRFVSNLGALYSAALACCAPNGEVAQAAAQAVYHAAVASAGPSKEEQEKARSMAHAEAQEEIRMIVNTGLAAVDLFLDCFVEIKDGAGVESSNFEWVFTSYMRWRLAQGRLELEDEDDPYYDEQIVSVQLSAAAEIGRRAGRPALEELTRGLAGSQGDSEGSLEDLHWLLRMSGHVLADEPDEKETVHQIPMSLAVREVTSAAEGLVNASVDAISRVLGAGGCSPRLVTTALWWLKRWCAAWLLIQGDAVFKGMDPRLVEVYGTAGSQAHSLLNSVLGMSAALVGTAGKTLDGDPDLKEAAVGLANVLAANPAAQSVLAESETWRTWTMAPCFARAAARVGSTHVDYLNQAVVGPTVERVAEIGGAVSLGANEVVEMVEEIAKGLTGEGAIDHVWRAWVEGGVMAAFPNWMWDCRKEHGDVRLRLLSALGAVVNRFGARAFELVRVTIESWTKFGESLGDELFEDVEKIALVLDSMKGTALDPFGEAEDGQGNSTGVMTILGVIEGLMPCLSDNVFADPTVARGLSGVVGEIAQYWPETVAQRPTALELLWSGVGGKASKSGGDLLVTECLRGVAAVGRAGGCGQWLGELLQVILVQDKTDGRILEAGSDAVLALIHVVGLEQAGHVLGSMIPAGPILEAAAAVPAGQAGNLKMRKQFQDVFVGFIDGAKAHLKVK